MKRGIMPALKLSGLIALLFFTQGSLRAQSLTDKLSEDDNFYKNYGRDTYSKLKIQKDVVGRYDFFGDHITDGVEMYNFYNTASSASSARRSLSDSMLFSKSNEFQKADFYNNFSNLVVSQDAIGGVKTSFLIGDQIQTKFTPLTFNMTNFKGIRWDIWSSKLQLTVMGTRTDPGALAMMTDGSSSGDANSLVEYPVTDSSFNANYYYNSAYTGSQDFSGKSPYGDYDLLMAAHAQQNIANKVDVGLTYINHHMSDIKKGEAWFKGQVPDGWMPNEIHFEFYDGTPTDTLDAGVYVDDIKMFINGREVRAKQLYQGAFRRTFIGDKDGLLLPRDIPIARPQSGVIPIIVAFQINPSFWEFADGPANQRAGTLDTISQIKTINFTYKVAGNYVVFVSTDRQIPLAIQGIQNTQTGQTIYSNVTKSVGSIYDNKKQVNAQPGYYLIVPGSPIFSTATTQNSNQFSTTYFGDYIAKSTQNIPISRDEFNAVCTEPDKHTLYANPSKYCLHAYNYEYNINVSSVTYGVNFRGELGGIKFSGEAALNQHEYALPGSIGHRTVANAISANLKAERPLSKTVGLSGEGYYIAPQWETNLFNVIPSQYFNQTTYKNSGAPGAIPDYLAYPYPFGNAYHTIDNNKDNDPFVENGLRYYPSDIDPSQKTMFNNDGTIKTSNAVRMTLPTGMDMTFDDPDGVIASKNDKNKNGIPDYKEDFLLFNSDPPVFDLGVDLNNNGIPDYEDDNVLPDFGHDVGYMLVGNSIKTLGVQGLTLDLRWTPTDHTTIDFGATAEGQATSDLVIDEKNRDGGISPPGGFDIDGKSFVAYATAKYQIIKRSQGLQIDIGNEFRAISDNFRNDAVVTVYTGNNTYSYYYYTDPLNFRRAVVDNLVGSVIYNNIHNFEYGFRWAFGAQKNLQIPDRQFYDTYTIKTGSDPTNPQISYNSQWEDYSSRLIGDANFIQRLSYTIGFKNDFEDWRRIFNPLNNLQIIPQYKLAFSMKREISGPSNWNNDPRSLRQDIETDINGDNKIDTLDNVGTNFDTLKAIRIRWSQYNLNNNGYLLNVPILRLDYKIAENTKFQVGLQWKRYFDLLSPEENRFEFSGLGQIVSKAQYKGYTVTIFLGYQWGSQNYDINQYDPALGLGKPYNTNSYQFFAKIYSGI
ncbi:MAG: hypothetical protein PHC61_05805 [Chitinivibrionales bacterium]|nr:hypothetical protein [Chitinivibrionales bacterium]